MSPWLFNVYMDGVVREVNVRVLGKGLVLLSSNGSRFEINQLLIADDKALVADSEEKLYRLVSDFGRVCAKDWKFFQYAKDRKNCRALVHM